MRSSQLNTKPARWLTHKTGTHTKIFSSSAKQDTPEDDVTMKPIADILLGMLVHIPVTYRI